MNGWVWRAGTGTRPSSARSWEAEDGPAPSITAAPTPRTRDNQGKKDGPRRRRPPAPQRGPNFLGEIRWDAGLGLLSRSWRKWAFICDVSLYGIWVKQKNILLRLRWAVELCKKKKHRQRKRCPPSSACFPPGRGGQKQQRDIEKLASGPQAGDSPEHNGWGLEEEEEGGWKQEHKSMSAGFAICSSLRVITFLLASLSSSSSIFFPSPVSSGRSSAKQRNEDFPKSVLKPSKCSRRVICDQPLSSRGMPPRGISCVCFLQFNGERRALAGVNRGASSWEVWTERRVHRSQRRESER